MPSSLSDTLSREKRAGEAPTRPGTRRQRAYRARARSGEAIVGVRINYHATIEALIASSRLSPAEALDRTKVEAAIAEIVGEWSRKWAEARDA